MTEVLIVSEYLTLLTQYLDISIIIIMTGDTFIIIIIITNLVDEQVL